MVDVGVVIESIFIESTLEAKSCVFFSILTHCNVNLFVCSKKIKVFLGHNLF